MNKSSAAVGLFVGCFLIYVSLFGLAGFADLYALQLGGVEDYTTYTEIDPSGHFAVASARIDFNLVTRGEQAYVYAQRSIPKEFTHTLETCLTGYDSEEYSRVIIWAVSNQIGAHESCDDLLSASLYQRYGNTLYIQLMERVDGTLKVSDEKTLINKDVHYYLTITKTGLTLTLKAYDDSARTQLKGTVILSLHSDIAYNTVYAVQSLGGPTPDPWISGYVVNLKLSEGTTPPPPPPNKGVLDVQCYYDGSPKAPDNNQITVNGQTYSTDGSGHWSGEVEPGSYTITALYNGNSKSETKSVEAGATVYVQLAWGSEPPPPPDGDDFLVKILAYIENFLANSTIRTLMLMVGIGLVGICGISLFMPGRKYAPVPRYY